MASRRCSTLQSKCNFFVMGLYSGSHQFLLIFVKGSENHKSRFWANRALKYIGTV